MDNKHSFLPIAVLIAVIAVPLALYAWYEHRNHRITTQNAVREASRLLKQDIRNDIAQAVDDALSGISTHTVTPDDEVIAPLATPLHTEQEQEEAVFEREEVLRNLNGLIDSAPPYPPLMQMPAIPVTPHATWKHCTRCGAYSYTAHDICDEPSHTVAMPLTPISNKELARVMMFLDSAVARKQIASEQERRAMSAFFLQLEATFAIKFEVQAVFDIFDMPDEEQQMFYCFLHDYLDRIDYEHMSLAQRQNMRVLGSTLYTHMHNVTFRTYHGILLLWQLDKARAAVALQKVRAFDAE